MALMFREFIRLERFSLSFTFPWFSQISSISLPLFFFLLRCSSDSSQNYLKFDIFMLQTRDHEVVGSSARLGGDKITDDPPATAAIKASSQSTVTLAYQSSIAGYYRCVTVLWTKNYMNHSVIVMVDSVEGDIQYTARIDLKPWHFWSRRSYKSLLVDEQKVYVYWDFRAVKFAGTSPEPAADYYVALVSDEELVLLLGDLKRKAYKRSKARPATVEPVLFYKKENVFAKKSFMSRARFDGKCKEHDILVEASPSGVKTPEMWIGVDGIVLVHVKNLQWKFRGNQTVLVDKQPVQVLWDVHNWLFDDQVPSNGLFIFKPLVTEVESDQEESGHGGDSEVSTGISKDVTKYVSTAAEFCLLLHAWKLD